MRVKRRPEDVTQQLEQGRVLGVARPGRADLVIEVACVAAALTHAALAAATVKAA